MITLLLLIPATMLTVAGYVVMYLSNRSEGGLKSFGKYLGFWAFTLAGLIVLGGIIASSQHHGRWGRHMNGDPGYGQSWMPTDSEPQQAPARAASEPHDAKPAGANTAAPEGPPK